MENSTGITEKTYVERAEEVMAGFKDMKGEKLTTTQIRKLLSMTADILETAKAEKSDDASESLQHKMRLLHVQIVYQAGRSKAVKQFVINSKLLELCKEVGSRRNGILLFCRYMEALVAFHRYNGNE